MLAHIHELINKNQGSISLSDFMSSALYHEKYGYYMNKVSIGKDGDFITAPEISQLFGEVIAVWIMNTWEKLGKPPRFSLVELGPGKGTLIHGIIRVTRKYSSFFDSMSLHLIEVSPALRKVQKQTLKDAEVSWHEDIDNLPEQPMIFLANEFFDALPVDQFVYKNGEWYENRITKQGDSSFNFTQFKLVPELAMREKLFDGAVLEMCTARIDMIKKIEEKIHSNKGAALIIDYGYIYPTYKSTLQSIRQHKYTDVLEGIGSSDITTLVDFSALQNALKYTDCEILTQREFLYSFGIKERMQILMKNADNEQKSRILSTFLRLTENMGTLFKVMLLLNI